jgi:hypothetical protein
METARDPRAASVGIARAAPKDRATYAEVQESEADLERSEKWLIAIGDRDYSVVPRHARPCSAAVRHWQRLRLATGVYTRIGFVSLSALCLRT